MICARCQSILYTEDELKCTGCKNVCHYYCVGQTEKNFKQINKEKFKCPTCKNKGSPEDKAKSNAAKVSPPGSDRAFFLERFDAMEQLIQKNKDEIIRSLEKRVKGLEEKLLQKEKQIEEMDERIDLLENRSRIQNIEIGNFPETKGENVPYIVAEIGKKIGMSINPGDIQVAHRVNTRSNNNVRPIIAMMGSRYLRNEWLAKYKEYKKNNDYKLKAKDINANLPNNLVYLQEHITVEKKKMLKNVKEFAKSNNYKFVWVREGSVLMKKDENENKSFKFATNSEWEKFKKNNFLSSQH